MALSVIATGGARSEAAEIGGVGLQTVHDWVLAFNADGPEGLIDGKVPGARPRLNADQRDVLKALGLEPAFVIVGVDEQLQVMAQGVVAA